MESTTKTNLSPEITKELVKAQFGSSVQIHQITELTAGWFNTAYSIQFTSHHQDVVLRIAPHPNQRLLTYEHDLMRKEVLVYESLMQAGTIPVPRLLAYDTRRQLIERDYMFIERLSGTPLAEIHEKLTEEERQDLHRQIGELAAAMRTIKNDNFGYFGYGPGCQSATWQEAFTAFIETLLDDGEDLGVELPMPYPQVRELFSRHAHTLEDIQEAVLVHWDLWPGNIFVIQEGDKLEIEGVIDWERAYWGDPESEPAIAAKFYSPAFFMGYGKEPTDDPNAVIRHKMYSLYLLLVMKIESKVRFENADHLSWVQTELAKGLKQLDKF